MKNYQRLYIFSLTLLLSMVSMSAWGADEIKEWDSGDCKVKYNKSNRTVEVTGNGRMADYGASRAPWYNEAISFRKITISDGVTHIGIKAFGSCSDVREVNIPSSMMSIGDKAFANCFRLEKFNILRLCYLETIGEAAFSNCNSLTTVELPNTVDSIGSYAFECCENLKSIDIPNGVKYIGKSAFYGCRSLTSFTFPGHLTTVSTSMFSGCTGLASISIPEGVTSVEASAFYGCKALTTASIPSTVRNIGDRAFYNCTAADNVYCYAELDSLLWRIDSLDFKAGKATSIHVIDRSKWENKYGQNFKGFVEAQPTASGTCGAQGDNVKWVLYADGYMIISGKGEMANFEKVEQRPWHFKNNEIKSVSIKEDVTSISNFAFDNVKYLKIVSFPRTLKSIGIKSFYQCKELKSTKFPAGLETIADNAFGNCKSITEVYIPASVKTIKMMAFAGLDNLKTVTFAEKSQLEVLPFCLFEASSSLEKVNIPASVKTIEEGAFNDCRKMIEVTIAANSQLQTIENETFYNNIWLPTITIPSGVTSIGNGAFYNCRRMTDVYCYADPEKLTWGNTARDFMRDKATKFHVYDAEAWKKKFPDANVTFVGDLKANARGDESTTGVNEDLRMKNEEFATAQWYSLDGRKLNSKPTQKGIYIMNGKKIVIR